jgi:molybdate transport system substrate-binding protein
MRKNAHALLAVPVLGLTFLCTALTAAPSPVPEPPEVMVYAATSLRDVLQDLAPRCEAALGIRLVFNFGGSNDLARQIEAGDKADVFFSADESWMDHVARAGLLDTDSRLSPLSNRLVVVVPKDSALAIHSAGDLVAPAVRRLSLANPDAVPAGKYAKAWLEKAGVWNRLQDRVVPGVDVRAALAAVESGAVEAGVVYRTDAAISGRARVAYEVPETDAPPISYALAAIRDRPYLPQARLVVQWLAGPEATASFERRGFILRDRRERPVP